MLGLRKANISLGRLAASFLVDVQGNVRTPASPLMLCTLLTPLKLEGLIALAVGFGGMLGGNPTWPAVAGILHACNAGRGFR